jgi:hypothetical protein
MDSYERFVRVMEFEDADRTPIFDSIDNDYILREIGGKGPPREVVPKAFKKLGIDATFQGFWTGSRIRGDKNWGDKYLVEMEYKTLTFRNLLFEKPFTRKWIAKYPTDWVIDRPFITLDDLRETIINPLLSEDEIIDRDIVHYCDIKKAYKNFGVVAVGICGGVLEDLAGQILGWPLFVRAIHQDRDLVRKIMDMLVIAARANVKAFIEAKAGPAFLYSDDIAEKHGLMHSLRFLREEWIPRVKKIIHPLLKAGIFVIHHSEGNTEGVLSDLVDIGIRGINPLEPFSMDLKKTKEKFRDRLVLTGGIDNAYLLQHGTPTMVVKETKYSIQIAAPGSGFCPGSSGNLNPGTSLDNALALYKTIIRFGAYPSARPAKT